MIQTNKKKQTKLFTIGGMIIIFPHVHLHISNLPTDFQQNLDGVVLARGI